MQNTANIVALLIPANMTEPMKPIRIANDLESMYPVIGTQQVIPVAPRRFNDCMLWVDEDVMSHEDNCIPNLRATVLAGIGLYGTAILVSEVTGSQQFRSWDEQNPLPFPPCVLQGFCEAVANSNSGRTMILQMTKEIA
jgi:hypothetical protein